MDNIEKLITDIERKEKTTLEFSLFDELDFYDNLTYMIDEQVEKGKIDFPSTLWQLCLNKQMEIENKLSKLHKEEI